MRFPLLTLVGITCLCGAGPLTLAQSPASPAAEPHVTHPAVTPGRDTVFLDPAHGGDDSGARLRAAGLGAEQIPEKDVTLALSNRLRFQLDALGIAVLATRETLILPAPAAVTATTPPTQPPTLDQRAGLANHAHPFACIVLHATESGSGVHILTAALPPEPPDLPITSTTALLVTPPLHWETAQASSLPQSERLATEIASALTQAGLPINRGHASIRPLNNLTCPAVLIELAPLSRTQGPTDAGYQARVTQALATALVFWRAHSATEAPNDPRLPGSTAAGSPIP